MIEGKHVILHVPLAVHICWKFVSKNMRSHIWEVPDLGRPSCLCICEQYYQALFRDGECFVHIVTLLNEERPTEVGSQLSLDVLLTLTRLLQGNEASKVVLPACCNEFECCLMLLLLRPDHIYIHMCILMYRKVSVVGLS